MRVRELEILMTDEQGLLRAIREDPADLTPRLIYADWLDEHGDPARAEFIRLQCLRSQEGITAPNEFERRDREEELLRDNRARWLAELPPLWGITWSEFGHGFVESVHAYSFRAFQRQAAQIRSRIPLLGLTLQRVSRIIV